MRPARLAIVAVAAALAAGLVQAPALAETSAPTTSPASVSVSADDLPAEPPVDTSVPAPTALVATTGAGSVTIAFAPPATTKAITNYEWSDQGGKWVRFDPSVTASPVTITGIQVGQPYSVALRAVTADGVGAASDPVAFRIEPPVPPKPTIWL